MTHVKISVERRIFPEFDGASRILFLTNDANTVEQLRQQIEAENLPTTKILNFDKINKVILLAEESRFDAILIDYETISENIISVLQYLNTNRLSKNTTKIVLINSNSHICREKCDLLLSYASRVINKTSGYFGLSGVMREYLVKKSVQTGDLSSVY